VLARAKTATPNDLLGINPDATMEQAQEAFHKIARNSHPDLHRAGLDPDELELVTSAYAAVAGAYQALRTKLAPTTRTAAIKPEPPPTASAIPVPATPSGTAPAGTHSSMSSKALVYYRKAELCLKRGDLKGAVLQVKLAIAADPASGFLRTALAEIESELRKP
jgi:hypothetical protein